MGRPVVALCQWEDFNYSAHTSGSALYDATRALWTNYGDEEPPTPCRASLGGRALTVWLPKGAVIRLRVQGLREPQVPDPMTQTFRHVYGSHERMTRTRITIRLTEYPHV